MKTENQLNRMWLPAALACALSLSAQAQLINNGGFESGFTGWTRSDQIGSDGTFALQSGTLSPVNAITVPLPPEGITAAMSDAGAPGSHVLYQDFVVPASVPTTSIGFLLFINNSADAFYAPLTLDFATPDLNQQARVDIMSSSADPFSVAIGDIFQNLYQTNPGDPLVSGYNNSLIDITATLNAHKGETLRLRFAEVDNVFIFNMGVDNVSIKTGNGGGGTPVPDGASTAMLLMLGLSAMGGLARVARI